MYIYIYICPCTHLFIFTQGFKYAACGHSVMTNRCKFWSDDHYNVFEKCLCEMSGSRITDCVLQIYLPPCTLYRALSLF